MSDELKKEKIGAQRTRKLLSNALFQMVETKPFENISVMDICQEALVPRSTFYNYFEDKYDLLNFCIEIMLESFAQGVQLDLTNDNNFMGLVNNVIDFLLENKKKLQNISRTNSNGTIFFELQKNIAGTITRLAMEQHNKNLAIPAEVIGIYHASGIIFTLKWWLEKDPPLTRDNMVHYIDLLIDRKRFLTSPAA